MLTHNKTTALLLAVAVASAVTAAAALRSQERPNTGSQEPPHAAARRKLDSLNQQLHIVDYEAPELGDPDQRARRRMKSARYDRNENVREPGDEPGIIYETEIHNHWAVGLTPLPADRSDAVIIGEVTAAAAHLSNDRTGVYSEFAVRVGEVLKDDARAPLTPGVVITAERLGGRVRFASGRVLPVRVVGQGIPRAGRRYVLFLKGLDFERHYEIVTGYELRGGRVSPLDGRKAVGGGTPWTLDAYEGRDEAKFLEEVRAAISNPHQPL